MLSQEDQKKKRIIVVASSWINQLKVSVMMKRNTIEFLERIGHLSVWRGKAGFQRDTLGLRSPTNIDTGALFDIAEIRRVRSATLVWNHGRFHMADECPLRLPEERMSLDIRRPSSSAKTLGFILDQQLADQGFA